MKTLGFLSKCEIRRPRPNPFPLILIKDTGSADFRNLKSAPNTIARAKTKFN